MDFADAFTQNLPELLARDLTRTKSEDSFLARRPTSGAQALAQALAQSRAQAQTTQTQPDISSASAGAPEILRHSLRHSTGVSHCASAEAGPHSLRDTMREHDDCKYTDIYATESRLSQGNLFEMRAHHMKQDRGEKQRLYLDGLDGLDGDCLSDSSVDVDAEPPSVRTRQQSFTTAATSSVEAHSLACAESPTIQTRHQPYPTTAPSSVDAHSVGYSVGCAAPSDDRDKQEGASMHMPNSSWVDFEPDSSGSEGKSEGKSEGEVESIAAFQDTRRRSHSSLGFVWKDTDKITSSAAVINVPTRRSSLSYAQRMKPSFSSEPSFSTRNSILASPNFAREFATQLFPPHQEPPPQQHLFDKPTNASDDLDDLDDLDDFEDFDDAAIAPVVPTSRHSERESSEDEDDKNPLPPLPNLAKQNLDHDLLFNQQQQQQQQENHHPIQSALLTKLRKARSLSKMPSLVSVHSWLESTTATSTSLSSPRNQHTTPLSMSAASGLRVSHDILDTLRVSIACFPETMLLTSSLTIETIRTYSRSLKRSSNMSRTSDEVSPSSSTSYPPPAFSTPSPTDTPKRWRLPKAFASRRTTPSPKDLWPVQEGSPMDMTGSASSSASEASWCCIRNIFPLGSDYLCNALYAHLVAYNYVVSICGSKNAHQSESGGNSKFTPPRPSMSGREPPINDETELDVDLGRVRERASSNTRAGGAIPKKAASLLGLPQAPPSDADCLLATKKTRNTSRGMFSSCSGSMPEKSETSNSVDSEAALGDLRDGLAGCVKRLVGTLKLTGASTGGGGAVAAAKGDDSGVGLAEEDENGNSPIQDGVKELDPLLMRALCEVVRCCEEGTH